MPARAQTSVMARMLASKTSARASAARARRMAAGSAENSRITQASERSRNCSGDCGLNARYRSSITRSAARSRARSSAVGSVMTAPSSLATRTTSVLIGLVLPPRNPVDGRAPESPGAHLGTTPHQRPAPPPGRQLDAVLPVSGTAKEHAWPLPAADLAVHGRLFVPLPSPFPVPTPQDQRPERPGVIVAVRLGVAAVEAVQVDIVARPVGEAGTPERPPRQVVGRPLAADVVPLAAKNTHQPADETEHGHLSSRIRPTCRASTTAWHRAEGSLTP